MTDPIVEANVVYLMRTLKVVSPDGTSGDALACFDRLVQENMSRVIRASIGRAGVRYEDVIVIVSARLFELLDTVGGHFYAGHSALVMIAFCIEWLFWSLVASPLNTSLCMYLCGYCTVLKGFKEMAFLALIATPVF